MNLEQAITHAMRTAKFSGVGDRFEMQVYGQGDWNRSDSAPSDSWLKNLLLTSGYNIIDARVTMVTQNPLGFAYGSRYAFYFQVQDEFSGGDVNSAFQELTAYITPFLDNFSFDVSESKVTPVSGGGVTTPNGGTKITANPANSGGTKPGVFTQIANDLKIPVAALAMVGLAVVLVLGQRK